MINKLNKVKVTTYLGKKQFDELRVLAGKMEASYATLIRMAISEFLKSKEKK